MCYCLNEEAVPRPAAHRRHRFPQLHFLRLPDLLYVVPGHDDLVVRRGVVQQPLLLFRRPVDGVHDRRVIRKSYGPAANRGRAGGRCGRGKRGTRSSICRGRVLLLVPDAFSQRRTERRGTGQERGEAIFVQRRRQRLAAACGTVHEGIRFPFERVLLQFLLAARPEEAVLPSETQDPVVVRLRRNKSSRLVRCRRAGRRRSCRRYEKCAAVVVVVAPTKSSDGVVAAVTATAIAVTFVRYHRSFGQLRMRVVVVQISTCFLFLVFDDVRFCGAGAAGVSVTERNQLAHSCRYFSYAEVNNFASIPVQARRPIRYRRLACRTRRISLQAKEQERGCMIVADDRSSAPILQQRTREKREPPRFVTPSDVNSTSVSDVKLT